MLLVAAALREELSLAMELCCAHARISRQDVSIWRATRNKKPISFLKTGVGPRRAAAALERALGLARVSRILVIGYAGALDPNLEVGDLVVVRKALLRGDHSGPALEESQVAGSWELADYDVLPEIGISAGLRISAGDAYTSPYVVGKPEHKRLLYERFHASVVDMETAALARAAASRGISLSCVRVVSDNAHDSFLAPISYDPSCAFSFRLLRIICAGTWIRPYREWKLRTGVAKESMRRFLACYL